MATASSLLKLKRVYEAAADDGARVLVDRLWPRGISKDRAALTVWLKDITVQERLEHEWDALILCSTAHRRPSR